MTGIHSLTSEVSARQAQNDQATVQLVEACIAEVARHAAVEQAGLRGASRHSPAESNRAERPELAISSRSATVGDQLVDVENELPVRRAWR